MSMSGTSSGGGSAASSLGGTSRSSEDDVMNNLHLQAQMENRRKRRKESNRESARRSRLRKQQHLDDLNAQADQLKDHNKQLGAALRVTAQSLVAVQAQNSVLQTQKMELESRLGSLTEILLYLNAGTATTTSAVNSNSTVMNHHASIATASSGACDVLALGAASTWTQPVDLYYPCF